ncbi:hypothetical protein ASG52_12530 [Methylobacterium sp. Leaf456]|uniref:DUF2336 domain-containing protein n=1 Tax=Methylobacterium sp. Leaf456 TaxID=1736382 RepID=UPI0006F96278|nr:DUF2336 domain-containing protein [Methylobacterium sp. Leaf456]KQT46550.1 hypothetical protein ASG52_12530 [Methylobacterium sp. Leaf456]
MPARPHSRAQLDALVAGIEQALRDGERIRQSQLVLDSADLLTRRWSRLPVADKPAFDALLHGLCAQIDTAARKTFAEGLADLRLGPPRTTRALASDAAAAVAAPLLARCTSLPPEFLADVAERGSEAHRLALATRSELAPAVTDALVRRGGARVAVRLLDNPGARFSPEGLGRLLACARESEAVTLRLALRPDLSPEHRPVLLDLTRARALGELRFDLHRDDDPDPERLIETVAETLTAPVPEPRLARFASSDAFVRQRFTAIPPGPVQLERWAGLRRTEDVLAGLARAAGLPLSPTVAAFDAADPSALAAILGGLEHPWTLLKALLILRHGEDVAAATTGLAYERHRRLGPLCARRLVRFGALRGGYLAFPAADVA